MSPYAQTYPQLLNQLQELGYSSKDLCLVRDAHEFAMLLFSSRFQPSGRSFIAHVVGTASVIASARLPAPLVAAGLLHNAYWAGDFGDGRQGVTTARRDKIRSMVGSEVEKLLARFASLVFSDLRTLSVVSTDPVRQPTLERDALLLLVADHLEDLCDLDRLYYEGQLRRRSLKNSTLVSELAQNLGFGSLATEIRERIRETETAGIPVELPDGRPAPEAFIIAAKSQRKRIPPFLLGILTYHARHLAQQITRLPIRKMKGVARRGASILHAFNRRRRYACLSPNSNSFKALFMDGRVEKVAAGFQFTEGPVWIMEDGSLLFSDIPADRILRLKADQLVEKFREPSGHSNGLTRDRQGRLISCEHGNRRVARTEHDGSITILASEFEGKRLNSPNDVVVKSDGAIYFTDPAYGIDPGQQEQPVEGVYRLSSEDTTLALVAGDLKRPNGLAFSPDEKVLYIADSARRHIVTFKVNSDGFLSDRSVFHDMNVAAPGVPDGMKVDAEGRVFCTGPGGVWVFDPLGKHLGTILTPEKPSNCAWGDDDRQTLYITAVSSVYKIRVRTPGLTLK